MVVVVIVGDIEERSLYCFLVLFRSVRTFRKLLFRFRWVPATFAHTKQGGFLVTGGTLVIDSVRMVFGMDSYSGNGEQSG